MHEFSSSVNSKVNKAVTRVSIKGADCLMNIFETSISWWTAFGGKREGFVCHRLSNI